MKIRLSHLRRIIRESIVEASTKRTPPRRPEPEAVAVWASPSGGSAYIQKKNGKAFYLYGSGNPLMPTKEPPPSGWLQLSDAVLSYDGIYPQLSVGGKPWNPKLGPPSPEFIMANSYNDRHDQPAPQAFDSPTVGRRRA